MKMYHPKLPYTKKNGGVEVSDKQYDEVWKSSGWKPLLPEPKLADTSFMDEDE